MAEILELEVSTVARGRRELLAQECECRADFEKRVAGSNELSKKTSQTSSRRSQELMNGARIAECIPSAVCVRARIDQAKNSSRTLGIAAFESGWTQSVAKLLKQMNFSLRTNKKKISNGSPPGGDCRVRQLSSLATGTL